MRMNKKKTDRCPLWRMSGRYRSLLRGMLLGLSIMLQLQAAAISAYAAGGTPGPDTGTGSITISYVTGGAEFFLYRAGHYDGISTWVTDGAFAACKADLTDRTAAQTLAGYIAQNALKADASGTTGNAAAADGKGLAGDGRDYTLRLEGLEEGVYLILGRPVEKSGTVYSAMPTLTCLPYTGGSGGPQWDTTVVPKHEKTPVNDGLNTYKVQVIWIGDTPEIRPKSVDVSLFENGGSNGILYPGEENNWRGSFDAKTAVTAWAVAQGVIPDGYSTTIELVGDTFVITNVYQFPKEDGNDSGGGGGSSPGGGGSGGSSGTGRSGIILSSSTGDAPEQSGGIPESGVLGASREPGSAGETEPQGKVLGARRLPQTGQLIWPIPLLLFCGLLCLLLGIRMGRSCDLCVEESAGDDAEHRMESV